MTKFKLILNASLFAFVISACDDKNVTLINDEKNLLTGGHSSFKTESEFFLTVEKLSKMSEEELDIWEDKHGFKSFRSIYKEAERKWFNLKHSSDSSLILNAYRDILYLKNGFLLPKIKSKYYQIICNREGYFQTGDMMNRVIDNRLYSTIMEGAEKLIEPNKFENELLINSIYADELDQKQSNGLRIQESSCSNSIKESYFDNPGGCKHDRRVYVTFVQGILQYTNYIILGDGTKFYKTYKQRTAQISIWGTARNWLCHWDDLYRTIIYMRNCSFTLYAAQNNGFDYYNYPTPPFSTTIVRSYSTMVPVTLNLPDYQSPNEEFRRDYAELLGDQVINEAVDFNQLPVRIHLEARTRGTTADGWAIIDCQ